MEKQKANCLISPSRISRIKAQGYDTGFSDEEISIHAVGNRFAYQLCTLLFATGLVLTSIPVLAVAAIIAFLTVILPYHPFDYLYNYGVRRPSQVAPQNCSGKICVWYRCHLAGYDHLFI